MHLCSWVPHCLLVFSTYPQRQHQTYRPWHGFLSLNLFITTSYTASKTVLESTFQNLNNTLATVNVYLITPKLSGFKQQLIFITLQRWLRGWIMCHEVVLTRLSYTVGWVRYLKYLFLRDHAQTILIIGSSCWRQAGPSSCHVASPQAAWVSSSYNNRGKVHKQDRSTVYHLAHKFRVS